MQNKQTTGLRVAASDYVTIVQQACHKVTGFTRLYQDGLPLHVSPDLIKSLYRQPWVVFAKKPLTALIV